MHGVSLADILARVRAGACARARPGAGVASGP